MAGQELYVPEQLKSWAEERANLRAAKNWAEADVLRDRIAAVGYSVRDAEDGFEFERAAIASADDVKSSIESESTLDWSVVIIARDRDDDLTRTVESVVKHAGGHDTEVIIVGNGQQATHKLVADLAVQHPTVRALYTTEELGEGVLLSAALRAAQGTHVLIMGVHIELTGDPFDQLAATLADKSVGVTGGWGVVTEDLMFYNSSDGPEVDAIEFYLFAFRRELLTEVELPDLRFHFYRNLDMHWSLFFKDKGYRLLITPDLPTETHEHIWLRTDPDEGERLSKKNYRHLLDKWRERTDLLVSNT